MNIRTDILLRVYIAFGMIVLLAGAVLYKLYAVQFTEGEKWKGMADSLSTKFINVDAVRGNIYSVDGSLLATSVPEYEIRMDMLAGGIEKDQTFYERVDSLADRLSAFFGDKSPSKYSELLRSARKDKMRYLLIKRNITHQELNTLRQFPIFDMGYQGGLIAIEKNKRILPFSSLAKRTIGYRNENVQPVGLEGAYGSYINGESGKRLMQRLAGGVWMPVNQEIEIAPKDGSDIISTIDINMQDVAQSALRRQLITSDADHGCVILMEVATGEIRAIANFTKSPDGSYQEKFNYAISESLDPGSTFKLASYLALLEDRKVDTNTIVETGDGTFKVHNKIIKESHGGMGRITVKKAFEESSNVAVAKLIYLNYKDNPSQFTDRLHGMQLNEKLGLQIPGESTPVVKSPKNRSWSGLTLPQMAYGYEMRITPLQMLAFYNAVANDGKKIAPLFVREIQRLGNTVENFKARVINEKIASDETIGKLQKMLEGVVEAGTGKNIISNPFYKVAGKTGTAQVADGASGYQGKKSYQASFCGYFPADNPKYSMIVVVNNPRKGTYYAALVAGPVFREIADKLYASDIQMDNSPQKQQIAGNTKIPAPKSGHTKATQRVYNALGMNVAFAANVDYVNTVDTSDVLSFRQVKQIDGIVPNMKGMGLKDAVYLSGNAGLRPVVKGRGRVVRQSVAPGMKVISGHPIILELE